MRSRSNQDDFTTRARIRDVAMRLFPERGFDATTVRRIASEAGVSPALVLHHFGSKEGLREVCDDYVVTRFREVKMESLERDNLFDPGYLSPAVEVAPSLLRYLSWAMVRSHGAALELFEEMLEQAVAVSRTAVERGYMIDSTDLESRVAVQLTMQLGLGVLHEHLERATGIDVFTPDGMRRLTPILMEVLGGLFPPDVRERVRAALAEGDLPARSF